MTNNHGLRDAAYSLMEEIEEMDRNRPERDSIEDRTGAEVVRDAGCSEEQVISMFGYSPTPIPRFKR